MSLWSRATGTDLLAPVAMTRSPSSPPSRAAGRSQVWVLLILGVGFLLIVSYQSEIHTVVLGEERQRGFSTYASVAAAASGSSEVAVKTPVRSVWQKFGAATEGEAVAIGHVPVVQRRLEADEGGVNASSGEPVAASSPPPPKKRDYKDAKNEDYMPLVESAHSNIVSARFQLVIKVLARNDFASLTRCLSSLREAEYAGDEVDIHIYIDHFEVSAAERRRLLAEEAAAEVDEEPDEADSDGQEDETATLSSVVGEKVKKTKKSKKSKRKSRRSRKLGSEEAEEEEDRPAGLLDRLPNVTESVKANDWEMVEERLAEARKVLYYVESFYWKYGKKVIHYRTTTAGSQSQWLDAWWPSNDDEFAMFVEDDAELSPLFYRYARSLIATYYYQPGQYDRLLYGISLQRPQIVPGKNGRPLKVDDRTRLFKYQMVGLWGQIFFPRPWKEFRRWHDSKRSHYAKPVVDGLVTTDWYKEHGEKVFTPWFVKFAYSQGYFNLYTNFLRDRVLSVTHRDVGGKHAVYSGCDSVLIWENGTYDLDLWHMASTWGLKRYDFCFKEVRANRFANYSTSVDWVVRSAAQNKQILMISAIGVRGALVKNWLCTLRKLDIQNHIFIGEDPVLLDDLSKRGHAAMRFENKQNLTSNVDKEVSAISDMLALGYSVWFARADTIWIGNPLTLANVEGADVVGLENSKLDLLFVRRTEETTKRWASLKEELSDASGDDSTSSVWESESKKFFKKCKDEGKLHMRELDTVKFIDAEDSAGVESVNSGESADGKVLKLSGWESYSDWRIKKNLQELNLWNLDEEMVCAKLICS